MSASNGMPREQVLLLARACLAERGLLESDLLEAGFTGRHDERDGWMAVCQ